MKRCLVLITAAVCLLLMAGCSLPAGKDVKATEGTPGFNGTDKATQPEESGMQKSGSPQESNESKTDISENVLMMPVTLYYQDIDGYLVPMTRWVEKQPGIARAAVNGLTDSAITREELQYYGVYPVLPVNTDIIGINIKDGIAVVDFNNKLLEYGSADIERNIIESLVYTLTEFATISSVKIKVNGYALDKLKYGTDVSGLLSRSNIPINSKLEKGAPKVEVYYFKRANEGFTYLIPVSVKAEDFDEITPDLLVRKLLQAKTDGKLLSEIPSEVKLLNCTSKNGVLTVDFNEKFLDYGGNAREEGLLKQLAYTVKQIGGINKLKIVVNGEEASLPEGTSISSGIVIERTINDIIDR